MAGPRKAGDGGGTVQLYRGEGAAAPASGEVAKTDAASQTEDRHWRLAGGKGGLAQVWAPSGARPRRRVTEMPAQLERVELRPAQPAPGSPAAKLLEALTAQQRSALGTEAHPAVGKSEQQVLSGARQRADGNFELEYTLVDKQNRALANDVNRVTLVVGPDGKARNDLVPEATMRTLGIDRMPEGTDAERAFKREVIAAEAEQLRLGRQVPPNATAERRKEDEGVERVSSVGVRAQRGRYTTAPPEIMEDVRTGGPRRLALERGHSGEGVLETQRLLNRLGAGLAEDGKLGPLTEAAIRQFQKQAGLPETGKLDAATYDALKKADPAEFKKSFKFQLPSVGSVSGATVPTGERLQAIRDAISKGGLPASWADDPNALAAINRVIEKESGWRVGVPNYTITQAGISKDRAIAELRSGRKNLTHLGASSSAMGLGQLLGSNMDKYMPSGRQGIGDMQEELIGALKYMKDRYHSPQAALQFHNSRNWW